jgi:hypothetical protein
MSVQFDYDEPPSFDDDPMDVFESDVLDYERTGESFYVHCEDCDAGDRAAEMRRQHDGSWLCWTCHNAYEADWQATIDDVRAWLAQA